MKLLNYIRTVPLLLNISLILSLFSIILIEGFLNDIPEIVSWGEEFGKIYYKLCISLMASYIFYFIVIHIKSIKDKENVGVFIGRTVNLILNDYTNQINQIKHRTDVEENKIFFSLKDINCMFAKIDPNSEAPLWLARTNSHSNWIEYFSFNNKRTQQYIEKVFSHMPFLDTKLVKLLAKIDNCLHFQVTELLVIKGVADKDLNSFSGHFYEYSKLCDELTFYYNKELLRLK